MILKRLQCHCLGVSEDHVNKVAVIQFWCFFLNHLHDQEPTALARSSSVFKYIDALNRKHVTAPFSFLPFLLPFKQLLRACSKFRLQKSAPHSVRGADNTLQTPPQR